MKALRKALSASHIHFTLSIVWACLAIPTLTLWRESVLWVGLISVYANVATHLGAWEAAKAKERAEDADLQTDHPPKQQA